MINLMLVKNRYLFVYGIFIFLFLNSAYSQNFIAIDTPNGLKRYRFYKGDNIKFQTTQKVRVKGNISSIDSNVIYVSKVPYQFKDIKKFRINKNRYGYNLASSVFTIAGAGSLGIGLLNGVANGDSPILNQNQIITGTSLIGLGIIASLLNQRTIKVKEKWQLKFIDLEISKPENY